MERNKHSSLDAFLSQEETQKKNKSRPEELLGIFDSLNPGRDSGFYIAKGLDKSGNTRISLGLFGMTSAEVFTREFRKISVTVDTQKQQDSEKALVVAEVDLTDSSIRGQAERKGSKRKIHLGQPRLSEEIDAWFGEARIGKKTVIEVLAVSPNQDRS